MKGENCMNKMKIPYGESNFEKLRKENYIYIKNINKNECR